MNQLEQIINVYSSMFALWGAKPSSGLCIPYDNNVLTIDRPPQFIRNNNGKIVGIDAYVRLFDLCGYEVPIDPHRIVVNPLVASDNLIKHSDLFIKTIVESVRISPNPKGWRTAGTVITIYNTTLPTANRYYGQVECSSTGGYTYANNNNYGASTAATFSRLAAGQDFASP